MSPLAATGGVFNLRGSRHIRRARGYPVNGHSEDDDLMQEWQDCDEGCQPEPAA